MWSIIVVMNDTTRILSEIEKGDRVAARQLLPLVYEELRKYDFGPTWSGWRTTICRRRGPARLAGRTRRERTGGMCPGLSDPPESPWKDADPRDGTNEMPRVIGFGYR